MDAVAHTQIGALGVSWEALGRRSSLDLGSGETQQNVRAVAACSRHGGRDVLWCAGGQGGGGREAA